MSLRVRGHVCKEPSPAELEQLLEYARRFLRYPSMDAWLEGGALPDSIMCGSSCGPGATPSFEYTRQGIAIYRPTPAERESHLAWGAYWEAKGGWKHVDFSDPDAPPRPLRETNGTWRGVSWAAVRRHLRDGVAGEQLALFEVAA